MTTKTIAPIVMPAIVPGGVGGGGVGSVIKQMILIILQAKIGYDNAIYSYRDIVVNNYHIIL